MANKEKWDLSELPTTWTVDDIEAKAPLSLRKIKQVCRILLYLPEHQESGYVPEFFLSLNFAEKMETKKKFQVLVDRGRLLKFDLRVENPARAEFVDSIIQTLEKGK